MTGREKLMKRMEANAEQFCDAYTTAAALLQTAMMEAMPWVVAMKTQGMMPNRLQLERLGTQVLAILMASLPPDEPPAMPEPDQPKQGAKLHSFK